MCINYISHKNCLAEREHKIFVDSKSANFNKIKRRISVCSTLE